VFGSETATDKDPQERRMTNNKNLIDAYHEALGDYEAAKAGAGNRVEMFTRFLVAERVLAARLGRVDPNLKRAFQRSRYRQSACPTFVSHDPSRPA
jgi:hypothetical protein